MFATLRSWGAAALLVAMASAPAMADTLTFKFREPADAEGWMAVYDRWKVKDGLYQPIFKEDGRFPVSLLVNPKFKDAKATVTFRPVRVDGTPYYTAGLLLRTKANAEAKTISGYLLLMRARDEDDADAAGFGYIYKMTDFNITDSSGSLVIICQKEFAPSLSGLGTLSFEASGDKLKAVFDGEPICSATDATYAKGQVGLLSYFSEPLLATEVTIKTK